MVSAIITCIQNALDDVEFLDKNFRGTYMDIKILIRALRNLKTFVLSARKLHNNVCLGSFFVRIEDTIRESAEEIHLVRDGFRYGGRARIIDNMLDKLLRAIQSFRKEIDKWYVTLLAYTRKSSVIMAEEVLEIIKSIMENLMDYQCIKFPSSDDEIFADAVEALREQMAFLKSLICFVTQRSAEPKEGFLAHSETVALDAAYLIFSDESYNEETRREMSSKISTLLQKIKPINPQVCETYTQALSSSKLRGLLVPTQNMDDDETIVVTKHFLNSLISTLWGLLRLDICVVFSKDQLKELYEGLRSLRTILNQQLNKLDMKTKEDLGDVLCDAGVLILSSYQTNIEADIGFQDLLQTMKNILAEAGEKDTEIPIFNPPKIKELGFLDLLLEKVMELSSGEAEPVVKSQVQSIQEELVFLRSFLGEIMELRNEQEELQALWDRVLAVANKIESLIGQQIVRDSQDSFSKSFDSVTKDVMNLKADVLDTFYGRRPEIEAKEAIITHNQMSSRRTRSMINEVVGFDNEAISMMERLKRGSQQLRVIAIVGMAGSGKTTLATKVYNDPSVTLYFPVRAWCAISQTLNKNRVLIDLLNQIDSKSRSNMNEEDLSEELRRILKKKRYLIFLDDIWDNESWNSLTMNGLLFPNDKVGSRIILTSRSQDVVPRAMLDQEPDFLRQLNKEETLELLQKKLFPQNGWPLELQDIGMQFAESCRGLPLTIVIVAGVLATIEPKGWKEILDDLSNGSVTESCMNTLELGYKILPNDLRSCLLYFGAFPEDQEVSVRKLIRIWIAEGFVQKTEMKSLEDAAEDYLKALIGRSLIMVSKQRSDGGIKACRIHDLLRDFCIQKAKHEHFFHFLEGCHELLTFNEPSNLRRLCIHSEVEHFKQSKLFCPGARSLLFNTQEKLAEWRLKEDLSSLSFVIHVFKLLKVLDLQQIHLVTGFPNEIQVLVHLIFLAIGGNIDRIPSSIACLSNLETLIVDTMTKCLLPGSLWDLRKLQYLYIQTGSGNSWEDGGIFPAESLDSSSILYDLIQFSGAVIPLDSMERLLRKFPKVRRLKCRLQAEKDSQNPAKIVVPDFLSELESLHMRDTFRLSILELSFPQTLKKLTLARLHLSSRNTSIIGNLPMLEVLKFVDVTFEGVVLEMKQGEFSKLRILNLSLLRILRWRACDDQFDCLEKLVLHSIRYMEELPCCLENIPTLETIDISHCYPNALERVRQIEEQQVMFGNSALKIIAGRNWQSGPESSEEDSSDEDDW